MKNKPVYSKKQLCVILLALLTISACNQHTQTPPGIEDQKTDVPHYEIATLDWKGQLTSSQRLVVINHYGDIQIRQSIDNDVVFHALMQKIGTQPKVAHLSVNDDTEKVTLKVVYPIDQTPETPQQGRVDVALLVPRNLTLDLSVETGKLTTKRLKNPVIAQSFHSDLFISTSGSSNLHSREGNIELIPILGSTARSFFATSSNGRIKVITAPEPNIQITEISGGVFASNNADLLSSRARKDNANIMSLGKGLHQFVLSTDAGDILFEIKQRKSEPVP